MSNLELSGLVRIDILTAALSAGRYGAHIAPSLSLVEIVIAVLKSFSVGNDSFILSKGHGALGYYAAMHQLRMITDEQFATFENNGSDFPGQPCRETSNCVEYSSGSLGMGLSYGVGVAFYKKSRNKGKVYVVLGDGELNEGSNWEAAALAARLNLSNLVPIVDCNHLQSDGKCEEIFNMDLERIWSAHGWNVILCDGHSVTSLQQALTNRKPDAPSVILAKTIKGKGVSFMEGNNAWHHQTLKEKDYQLAIKEIEARYELC